MRFTSYENVSLKSNERVALLLVRTKRAKSYRERRKLARAAGKGSVSGSGKYREEMHDDMGRAAKHKYKIAYHSNVRII